MAILVARLHVVGHAVENGLQPVAGTRRRRIGRRRVGLLGGLGGRARAGIFRLSLL